MMPGIVINITRTVHTSIHAVLPPSNLNGAALIGFVGGFPAEALATFDVMESTGEAGESLITRAGESIADAEDAASDATAEDAAAVAAGSIGCACRIPLNANNRTTEMIFLLMTDEIMFCIF